MRHNHRTIQALCEGAVLIALALILGLFKFNELPQGGSISFEMLPLFIFITRWGPGWGLIGCFAFGILQVFVQGAVSYGWVSILLDYVVAFGVIGFGGFFRGKIFAASVVGAVCRFIIHFISGITVYKILVPTSLFGLTFVNPWIYSLVYNGVYMIPEIILTCVVGFLLVQFAGKQVLDSRMTFRREGVPMGLPGFSEFEIWQTSEANIRAARTVLDAL